MRELQGSIINSRICENISCYFCVLPNGEDGEERGAEGACCQVDCQVDTVGDRTEDHQPDQHYTPHIWKYYSTALIAL